GSALFFFFTEGGEIWSTDGSAAGTRKTFDLDDQDEASPVYFLSGVAFGDGALFATWGPQTGVEIWRSDEGSEGARRIDRVDVLTLPQRLTRVGNLVFFTAQDGAGTELWATDGRPGGTRRVRDLAPGRRGSFPRDLTAVGDRLFFTADDGVHGREVWSSDGTPRGTTMVADLALGPATSFPQHLAGIPGGTGAASLAIAAGDGSGAALLADVAPGDASSSPSGFAAVGDRLYFAAGLRRTGRELWKATLPP